jgi:hypothetical protein
MARTGCLDGRMTFLVPENDGRVWLVDTWLGFLDHPTHRDSSDFGCKVLSWSSYSTSVWGPDGGRDELGEIARCKTGSKKAVQSLEI